ncbi:hypothetical protein DPMN_070394, partial [Dreissena polymorpha]
MATVRQYDGDNAIERWRHCDDTTAKVRYDYRIVAPQLEFHFFIFFDFTYDGLITNGFLQNSLGQLTDGEEGDTNFRLDPQELGIKDTVVEYARKVQIKLGKMIARYVTIDLYFDAKWILISEVQFDSSPVAFPGNYSEELPPPTTVTTATSTKLSSNRIKDPELDVDLSNGPRIHI